MKGPETKRLLVSSNISYQYSKKFLEFRPISPYLPFDLVPVKKYISKCMKTGDGLEC